MNELHAVLDAWHGLGDLNRDAVLATVVHVSGSAYRRPGARMLIIRDGRRVGSISGGCLEGDIIKKAWWLTDVGAVVQSYDTTSDDDADPGYGLGCNGVVQILLERVTTSGTREMLEFLQGHRESREPAVVATVIRAEDGSGVRVGDRLLIDEHWVRGGALVGSAVESVVRAHALEAFSDTKSRLAHLADADVFIEWIGPPLSVVVFGAGDDAVPLVAIAQQLGWRVSVADGRPAYAKPARFAAGCQVLTMTAGDPLRGLDIDERTAVVMMTHNFPQDARLLPLIVARHPYYLGILGPRSRTDRLFAEVGLKAPPTLHGPVGLDIGGDHPSATALSIVAEIQAETNHRAGGMLRLRDEAIHPPAAEVGAPSPSPRAEGSRPEYCETMLGSHA